MQMNGLIGGLYIFTEWITRLAMTNILWVLYNFPVVFFSLNIMIAETTGERMFFMVSMIVLIPLIFFPATMAMFALIRRWSLGESDIKIFSSFWLHYKENYVRSMLGGFIFALIWAILLVDYYYFVHNVSDLLKYLFYALFLFTGMFNIHFFSNSVHFHLKLSLTIKNALFMTLKNPVISVILALVNVGIVVVSFKILPFLVPFFMGSFITIVSFLVFYTISLRIPTT